VLTLGAKDTRPHTAAKTQDLIKTFAWKQMYHPPYSRDLAPSDFHVFLHLKKFIGGWRFVEDDDVKEAVNTRFSSQAASLYDAGIQKLVPRYDKCLNNGGN
jgi:histone-lysine N-methyltransferase SETMAR